MNKALFEVFCIYWCADVKRNKSSLLTAACAQSRLPDDRQLSNFAKCFQGGSFSFSSFWRPDKNREPGQVCVYAHSVWLTMLIPFLGGWMNIKAFQIFGLSFEVTVKEIWEQNRGLVSLPDATLLTAHTRFLKHSVILVKWNIKIIFTLLHELNYWFASEISLIFYGNTAYDKIV